MILTNRVKKLEKYHVVEGLGSTELCRSFSVLYIETHVLGIAVWCT